MWVLAVGKKKLVKSYLKLIYFVFSIFMIISVFLPWVSIGASFSSEVYDEYGYVRYDASLVGAHYSQFANITGTVTEKYFSTTAPGGVVAFTALILLTSIILLVYGITGFNLEALKGIENIFKGKDRILVFSIATIQLVLSMIFFLTYNDLTITVEGESYTISEFKHFILSYMNSLPFAGLLDEKFFFDYGVGAYIALIFSLFLFLLALGDILYTMRKWSKTWIFKGSLTIVVIVATLLPWVEIFDPEKLTFTIEIGFITASGLIAVSLLAFILFLIDSYNQGMLTINRLYEEIYKTELTEEEMIQRRNRIEYIYRLNRIKRYAIIILALIVLVLIAASIKSYMALYIELDKIGGEVRSLVGLWLVWLSHLAFLISLFLFRD